MTPRPEEVEGRALPTEIHSLLREGNTIYDTRENIVEKEEDSKLTVIRQCRRLLRCEILILHYSWKLICQER